MAVVLLLYAAFVVYLVLAGRTATARAVARVVPDCIVLSRRLLRDPRVPRRKKIALAALSAYLLVPVDIVPDFIPVAGYLDDAVIVALVMRYVLKGSAPDLIAGHWPGPQETLDFVLRLAARNRLPA